MYTVIYGGCDEVLVTEFLDDVDEWFTDNNINPNDLNYRVIFTSLEDCDE